MAHDSIPAPLSAAWRYSVELIDRFFPPPRPFAVRLWDGTSLPAAANSPFTLVLNHPVALRRMYTPPIERALGEAFICGDFDIAGDIFAAVTLFDDLVARRFTPHDLIVFTRELLALPKPTARTIGRGPA